MDKPKIKVYMPRKTPCDICGADDSYYWLFCRQPEGELPRRIYHWNDETYEGVFTINCCRDCRDKVPYEIIPIKTEIGPGYFYCPYPPNIQLPGVADASAED